MNNYFVFVRLSEQAGSALEKVCIKASSPFAAISMARAMYGRLLLSESANCA